MGQATCSIIDLDGALATVQLVLDESNGQGHESDSPTPSNLGRSMKRALVRHPIPNRSQDLGQDMGPYSEEYTVDGLSLQDVRDKLDAMFWADQFTTGHPAGRFRFIMTSSFPSTVEDRSDLAIESYSWRYVGGLKRWFRYNLKFVKFSGQT
jgi:hypothetical protein